MSNSRAQGASSVWDVLATKAQNAARQAQQLLIEAQQRKELAVVRSQKLDQLLAEYAEQLNAIQRRNHSILEAGNYRNFIVQLQMLKGRSKAEFLALDADCTDARKRMATADQERLKVESLARRAQDQAREQQLANETRETEAQGIMQYNLRNRSRP
jgi:flagellar export protein FliJ